MTTALDTFTKDPQAVLDYTQDWTKWLAGDTIASATASIGTQTSIAVDSTTHTASTVTAWVSGGVVGARYYVTVTVVTVGRRTDERSFYIDCKQL